MNEETKSRAEQLKFLQSMPLDDKVSYSLWRIRQFLSKEDAYVSFSGGKDSTVLSHLVHKIDVTVPLVFSNTGLEYQSIQTFAKNMGAEFVRPKMNFSDVLSTKGYPIVGKEVANAIKQARNIRSHNSNEREDVNSKTERTPRIKVYSMDRKNESQGYGRALLLGIYGRTGVDEYVPSMFNKEKWLPLSELPIPISDSCCQIMKKSVMKRYETKTGRKPIVGTLAEESRLRKQHWIQRGCNSFEGKIESNPLSFWTNQDILRYVKREGIEICSVYGDIVYSDPDGNDVFESLDKDAPLHCTGCKRTGCVYCMFGAHIRGDNRFIELQKLAPRQFDYSFGGGQWVDNPKYDPFAKEYDGEWKNWNPKKIWVPSKQGLGLKYVIDSFNELYPNNKIKY